MDNIGARSMIIKLEDINNAGGGPIYVAGRQRLASATAVRFIDDERLVAASLKGQRLYVIEYDFESGSHAIQSAVPTRFHGEDVSTELLDYDGSDRIATSNFHGKSVSLYRLRGTELTHEKDLEIRDDAKGDCHGVKFVPPGGRIICATCVSGGRNVYFLDSETGHVVYKFSDGAWRPKDVCFVDDRRMIVIYTDGSPSQDPRAAYRSKASLVTFDLTAGRHESLSEIVLEANHVDCCVHAGGRVYIGLAITDSVLVCRVNAHTIEVAYELAGPDLDVPHGLDVWPAGDLLAVTNYGSNTILIRKL